MHIKFSSFNTFYIIADSDGIIYEESELMNYLPFGLSQNENILSECIQEEACRNRVFKWVKLILDQLSIW